jgi:predicted nucleic acid-binding protein
MTDRIFVDSNIWIYLFTTDDSVKSKAVKKYISERAEHSVLVVSYQVVNEVCCVLKKKKYAEPELRRVAKDIMGLCDVCEYSDEIIFFASEIREHYSFSYWDSQIVAAALMANCDILASEDLQDGLKIDNMSISNVLNLSN